MNLTTDDTTTTPSAQLGDDSIIITGTKHKKRVLQEYESKFGNDIPHPIVTRLKGKHSTDSIYAAPVCMKHSIKKYYRVQELTLYRIITMVIKEFWDRFNPTNLINLSKINNKFSIIIPNTI